MKSPLPGMDPSLERTWRDAHAQLISRNRGALNGCLPDDLMARIEERITVESPEGGGRVFFPDALVNETAQSFAPGGGAAGGMGRGQGGDAEAAVAEPVVLEMDIQEAAEEATEGYITILDHTGETIITVIECLIPSNKRGDGLDDYRQKRDDLLQDHVNLVEIDLVRQGDWLALMRQKVAPEAHLHTTYRVVIRRAATPRRVDFFPITLQQRLPTIPIPLRETDEDVPLNLQTLIDEVYEAGRYDRTDYSRPLDPPLIGEDAAWAAGVLVGR